jgi:hypothetical protein
MRPLSFATIAVVLSFYGSTHVCAWEADVHFGLTKWLALQAGFSEQEAEWIALGNQETDDSWVTNPLHTAVAACFKRDAAASASAQSHHFPSRFGAPNEPAIRSVTPGEVWHEGSKLPRPVIIKESEATYRSLGRYLHAFQDTWSHRGQPDVPLWGLRWACDPRYAWGHPKARGGWACHTADYTFEWQQTEALPMARATYEELVGARGHSSNLAWVNLEKKISEFSSAKSKNEKARWFRSEGFTQRSFLKKTSLPNCENGASACENYPEIILAESWLNVVSNSKDNFAAPDPVVRFLDRLFEAMINGEISSLRKEAIDEERAAAAYAKSMRVENECRPLFSELFDFMYGAGFVTTRGAHQPLSLCTAIARLDQMKQSTIKCGDALALIKGLPQQAAPRGGNLKELMGMIGKSKPYRYGIAQGQAPSEFVSVAQFINLPRDALIVEVDTSSGVPRATSLIWVPAE